MTRKVGIWRSALAVTFVLLSIFAVPTIRAGAISREIGGRSQKPAIHESALSNNYFYASSYQYTTASGAYGTYLVEDPTVPGAYSSSGAHSLAEMFVESSDGLQIIEVGWIISPGQSGDNLPHFFVFHWVNRSATCYNGCGFVSTSATVTAGMALTSANTCQVTLSITDGLATGSFDISEQSAGTFTFNGAYGGDMNYGGSFSVAGST